VSYAQTLILNHTYRPHEIVDWKEAVFRMFRGKLEVLVQYDEVLTVLGRNHLATFPELRLALRQVIGTDAESITIKVPAVAVVRRKIALVKSGAKFSKINVCLRDDFTCMYCGKKLPMSQLNYDHVIPRDQGGKTVWNNIVMACYPCNSKKANKTPEEAGMRLLTVPRQPKTLPMPEPRIDQGSVPEEWLPFITAAA
jgi:5-methylcytosine-specific restriction endonuclease McrA